MSSFRAMAADEVCTPVGAIRARHGCAPASPQTCSEPSNRVILSSSIAFIESALAGVTRWSERHTDASANPVMSYDQLQKTIEIRDAMQLRDSPHGASGSTARQVRAGPSLKISCGDPRGDSTLKHKFRSASVPVVFAELFRRLSAYGTQPAVARRPGRNSITHRLRVVATDVLGRVLRAISGKSRDMPFPPRMSLGWRSARPEATFGRLPVRRRRRFAARG